MSSTLVSPIARDPVLAPAAVSALVELARPEILAVARPDSCIFSTRVAIGVLRRLGFTAGPMAVTASIYNPPLVRKMQAYLDEYGVMPPTPLAIQWQLRPHSDCWAIGIGFPPADGSPVPMDKWAGHLVALVSGQWLVDLSIDQAARPARNLFPKPLATEITSPMFLGAHERLVVEQAGMHICYERITDQGWQRSRDWNLSERWQPTVERVLDLVRERLGHK